ncbi:MAG: RNA polymerase factor sigma-54 [Saprospiraceae bacterium]|nr:RNA polymerase factor sigma-54 [Saprospiraceae bacterium]
MFKQNLSQKLVQKLSPQQIQLMKLLQVPTSSLEQRIKEELEENPVLEEGENVVDDLYGQEDGPIDDGTEAPEREEEFELDDYLSDYIEDDPGSYKLRSGDYTSTEEDKTIPIPVQDSFQEYLQQQLQLLEFEDERQEIIARQIIGSIDDDGYLRRDPIHIIDDLMFSQGVSADVSEVEHWLQKIQRFDPPGTGARDLRECLLIQLRGLLEQEDLRLDDRENLELAEQLIDKHFESFAKKHFARLQKQLEVDESELRGAMDEIIKLNPKPASGHSSGNSGPIQYVVPDFIIINREGELELSLNSRNAPDLRVSEQYQEMLRSYRKRTNASMGQREKETYTFIKQKIDSARWFIDAIQQRQDTMYRTMYSIMRYQEDFFLSGDQRRLRPMILKDIADITGLDISTVSRVANSKFVQTEFGTKRLKDFFSESLQTQDGEEVSTFEVKKILSEIIGKENKRKPYSDEKLKDMLQDKGYNIARRTVAKYREQLNISVARLRKEL